MPKWSDHEWKAGFHEKKVRVPHTCCRCDRLIAAKTIVRVKDVYKNDEHYSLYCCAICWGDATDETILPIKGTKIIL